MLTKAGVGVGVNVNVARAVHRHAIGKMKKRRAARAVRRCQRAR